MALAFMLLVSAFGHAQEFKVYDNGLIYDNQTMARLGKIVDSLNIRFRNCDLAHPYYSLSQGFATQVSVPHAKALDAIQRDISLENYLRLYPQQTTKKWIVRYRYTNYKGKQLMILRALGEHYEATIDFNQTDFNKEKGWIAGEKNTAIYLHDVKPAEIPEKYGRLVQYVDCMIDTTALIFTGKAGDDRMWFESLNDNPKAELFLEYTKRAPGEPQLDEHFFELNKNNSHKLDSLMQAYATIYQRWQEQKYLHIENQMNIFPQLREWLEEGTKVALENGNSTDEFEVFVARYISKETALKLKRGCQVYGQCSMDSRPRQHAASICMLSAETAQWDIFLRSHLDIMNDNFHRVSDGSWARAERETYLKELEMLDIDAVDLLVGTCLSVQNVSENHYYGSTGRIGRALAEARNKDVVNEKLHEMIDDPALDPVNRLRMASVFSFYSNTLTDPLHKQENLAWLEASIRKMPAHMQQEWNLE